MTPHRLVRMLVACIAGLVVLAAHVAIDARQ
jgi:hypothetical protein